MTKMLRRLRPALAPLVSLATIGGMLCYLYIFAAKLGGPFRLSAGGVFALLVLSLAGPVLNGLINVVLFGCLGVGLSRAEGFHLAASGTLANQLPLPGGLIGRGLYLRSKYDLSYVDYFSAALALLLCSIGVSGCIGAAVLLYAMLFRGLHASPVLLAMFGMMSASLIVLWPRLSSGKLAGRMGVLAQQALRGWILMGRNPRVLPQLMGLQTSFMLVFALRLWIAFRMLSQDIDLDGAILLACGSMLTQLATFAPGGLGVREAIVGAIATVLGFDLRASAAAVALDRLVSTLVIVIVGGISSVLIGRDMLGEARTKSKRQ